MGETLLSTPSTSDFNATTTGSVKSATTCEQPSVGSQTADNCTLPSIATSSSQPWYERSWTTPAAYLIIVYVVASACVMLLLLLNGLMDRRSNLDNSYEATNEREFRRRRRHSQWMENWLERERRDAEDTQTDTEDDPAVWVHEGQQLERQQTFHPGVDTLQQAAMQQRHEHDARVVSNLRRAGLL